MCTKTSTYPYTQAGARDLNRKKEWKEGINPQAGSGCEWPTPQPSSQCSLSPTQLKTTGTWISSGRFSSATAQHLKTTQTPMRSPPGLLPPAKSPAALGTAASRVTGCRRAENRALCVLGCVGAQASASPYPAPALHPLWGVCEQQRAARVSEASRRGGGYSFVLKADEQNATPCFALVCFHSNKAFRKSPKTEVYLHF